MSNVKPPINSIQSRIIGRGRRIGEGELKESFPSEHLGRQEKPCSIIGSVGTQQRLAERDLSLRGGSTPYLPTGSESSGGLDLWGYLELPS